MVPVLDEDGHVGGVVTEGNMTSMILSGRAAPDASVKDAKVVYKTFRRINMGDSLADLAQALDHEAFALVITEQRCYNGKKVNEVLTKSVVSGIVTRIDLLDFISNENKDGIV